MAISEHYDDESSPHYIKMSDISPLKKYNTLGPVGFRPVNPHQGSSVAKHYPSITPLMNELERASLANESQEADQLCKFQLTSTPKDKTESK